MADVDLSLVNAALTRTGNDTIASLDDGSVPATVAGENYEQVVKSELARSRFKLPSKFTQLSLIDEDEQGSPPEPWTYGYTLPTDLVKLRTIKVSGTPIPYEQVGRIVFCDFGSDDEVIAHYLWRPPESWFAPEFSEGIIRRMEAIFLRALGERYDEAALRDKAADEQFAFARASDSQAQTPTDPMVSPALRARNGVVPSSPTLRARRGTN
jgi:hypothetical protein